MSSTPGDGPIIEDRVAFGPEASAPAMAREFITRYAEVMPSSVVNDALVLVSELVTNAVRYGRGDRSMRIRITPSMVRVDVHDLSDVMPSRVPAQVPPDAPGGRGLLIVDSLATRWGVESARSDSGKSVWFELE